MNARNENAVAESSTSGVRTGGAKFHVGHFAFLRATTDRLQHLKRPVSAGAHGMQRTVAKLNVDTRFVVPETRLKAAEARSGR